MRILTSDCARIAVLSAPCVVCFITFPLSSSPSLNDLVNLASLLLQMAFLWHLCRLPLRGSATAWMTDGRERLFSDVRFSSQRDEALWAHCQCLAWADACAGMFWFYLVAVIIRVIQQATENALLWWAVVILRCCGVLFALAWNFPLTRKFYKELLLIAIFQLFAEMMIPFDGRDGVFRDGIRAVSMIDILFSTRAAMLLLALTASTVFVLLPPLFVSACAWTFFVEWIDHPRIVLAAEPDLFQPSLRLIRSRPSAPPSPAPRRRLAKGTT